MSSISLTDQTTIELHHLHVGDGADGVFEVGRADTGVFVGLPPEGVDLLTWLQSGLPVGEVRERFATRYGQPPDLDGFVEAMAECGFLRRVDGWSGPGIVTEPTAGSSARGWRLFGGLQPQRVRWLLSRPMKALYLAVWLATPILLVSHPGLVPAASDAWIHPRVMVNVVALMALGWLLLFLHELAHVLAAKAIGCASSLSISHRLHFLVAQTDLTSVRTQPHHRRYGPYLAGLTWDLALLAGCLALQLAGVRSSFPKVIAYLVAMSVIFQFAFFMRTDIYYVVVNWLRLGNLMGDTRQWLANVALRILGRPERHDLSAVPARELRVVRWYAGFCVAGVGVALGNFFFLGLPVLVGFMQEAARGLVSSPARAAFWDGVVFFGLFTLNFGLLGYLAWSGRRQAGRRAGTREPAVAS